jgi:GxxExxY protein
LTWISVRDVVFHHEEHEGHEEMKFDDLSHAVIGCALEVHKLLGPGLLESTYEQCLAHELTIHDILFKIQPPLPVIYKDIRLDCGYRIDLLIENKLIVELKSVDAIKAIHEAQLLTYMKLAKISLGFIINFNVRKLKDGIKRYVL